MQKGILYLIPTPISDEISLHHETKKFLEEQIQVGSIMAVEELKPCRRRWLSWGLPREEIEKFELYNEHNRFEKSKELIHKLKKGQNICLMSDCGLPAFCDPGKILVELAHKEKIKVSASAFDNSIILALALSGFSHDQFWFAGFLPKDKEGRFNLLESIDKRSEVTIIMDTPYRLTRVLDELSNYAPAKKWKFCLATQLGHPDESVKVSGVQALKKEFNGQKREFIMVIEPSSGRKRHDDKTQKRPYRAR